LACPAETSKPISINKQELIDAAMKAYKWLIEIQHLLILVKRYSIGSLNKKRNAHYSDFP
jgi:hypothetical protein